MTNIFTEIDIAAQAEKITQHYTASAQETAPSEAPDGPAEPATSAEMESLDQASKASFLPLVPDAQSSQGRASVFVAPGEWVSPALRQKQRKRMTLPSAAALDDLDRRITKAVRFDNAPDEVASLGQRARLAVGAAREAHESARHPDNRRYAVSTEAKDTVVLKIAEATAAVGALEDVLKDPVIQEAWFDSLVENLNEQRAKAADALEAATRAYSVWRRAIADADALAKAQERWGEWHQHPEAQALNPLGLISELQKALAIATSEDDWVNGNYLTADYGNKIPPHTMAALEASARNAPGSFAESLFLRLKSVHPDDWPAMETIQEKDLRIINRSPVPFLHPDAGPKGYGSYDGRALPLLNA